MAHRILVIDDDEPILTLMRLTLGKDGYEVLCADSGALGLQMYHDEHPDLVMVDIAMPEVNGYHVIDHIRQHEGESKHTPILVLTAFPEAVINRDLDEMGADLSLTKPISGTELLQFVRRLLGEHTSS